MTSLPPLPSLSNTRTSQLQALKTLKKLKNNTRMMRRVKHVNLIANFSFQALVTAAAARALSSLVFCLLGETGEGEGPNDVIAAGKARVVDLF